MAQNWTDSCIYDHGQAINSSTLGQLDMGQNLYAKGGSGINLTSATLAWFSEKTNYAFDTMTCLKSQMCGHYTQVEFIFIYLFTA